MVTKTKAWGIDAECIDLCMLENSYDVVTAVFDMLNYVDKVALKHFLKCVYKHLNEGGYFLCDINTLYGFKEVAVGSFIVDDERRFLTIDSEFDEGKYTSDFTLFEKEGECFRKYQETIKQYYHTLEEIVALSGLELVQYDEVALYEMEQADKIFMVLKK